MGRKGQEGQEGQEGRKGQGGCERAGGPWICEKKCVIVERSGEGRRIWRCMNTNHLFMVLACTGVLIGVSRLSNPVFGKHEASPPSPPKTAGASIERGRHLVRIGGCNDCHTPGFMQDPNVPESEWLTGAPIGWRGPWGTTYASNLRRHLAAWDDSGTWIEMVRSRHGLPPMPWPSLHAMEDEELKSLYLYIRSLPVTGEFMPAPVPPDRDPVTPWLNLEPVMPKAVDQGL